jgi:eukaryotic-like serine/threonine-protein kinase
VKLNTVTRSALLKEAGELSNKGFNADAGWLILKKLGIKPRDAHRVDSADRKLAYLAATYFAKGGETQPAMEVFVAIGDRNRAADILEKAGDLIGAQRIRAGRASTVESIGPPAAPQGATGGSTVSKQAILRLEKEGKFAMAAKAYFENKQYADAARVMQKSGRLDDAAKMYAEANMPYEAAACFLKVGDTANGLKNLIRVPSSDERYRTAAQHAARLAIKSKKISFEIEHFLTAFFKTPPTSKQEAEIYYRLGELYEKYGLHENAADALQKLVSVSPGYRDAKGRLKKLEEKFTDSAGVYDKIKEQDSTYHGEKRSTGSGGKSGILGLPPVPNMPDLPPVPQLTSLNLNAALAQNPPAGQVVAEGGTMYQGGANVDMQVAPTIPPPPVDPAMTESIAAPAPAPAPAPAEQLEEDPGFVEGNTIADRYRLEKQIGQGGMAIVFKAFDLELDEEIALKVFLQQVMDPKMQAESLARFKQELKLSRQLTHKNIIRLYDIGLHSGYRYISMELLRGVDLDGRLSKPMDFAQGISYLVQSCEGLQAAHDKGVVHRDIKPENIFVCNDESVKIMDFGIAKNTVTPGLTMEGMMAGTPQYMAPEQINNFAGVTASVDLYSLGLVAYRMFTGTLAFDCEELGPLLMMHLNEQATPPNEINTGIPDDLNDVIMRCLEKDPANRFVSATELGKTLRRIGVRFRRNP